MPRVTVEIGDRVRLRWAGTLFTAAALRGRTPRALVLAKAPLVRWSDSQGYQSRSERPGLLLRFLPPHRHLQDTVVAVNAVAPDQPDL